MHPCNELGHVSRGDPVDGTVAEHREHATERGPVRRTTEHLIHNQDGTIGEARNSYGADPADRPG
jgi:hypothetical protein